MVLAAAPVGGVVWFSSVGHYQQEESQRFTFGKCRSTMVGGTGLEPVTSAMSTQRSNQLS